MHHRSAAPSFFRQCTALLALYAFFVQQYIAPTVWANPLGGTVTAGSATIFNGRGVVTIDQSSPKAIITWNDFSISGGETTNFIHGTGSSGMTLNRVTGSFSSTIAGNLTANGQVFLINPNGILVTGTGVINTATFLGSTRDITDSNFLTGTTFTLDGTSNAGVEIQPGAKITAAAGDVILLGQTVTNGGELTAAKGVVGLAAGKQIIYQPTASEAIRVVSGQGTNGAVGAQNTGTIAAAQAELRAAGGNVYAVAVNARGTVTATSTATRNGRILLTSGGGNVSVGGTQKAVGRAGTISTVSSGATSEKVIVAKDATLEADIITLAARNSVRTGGTLNAPGGSASVVAASVEVRGAVKAANVRVQSNSSLKVAKLAAAAQEPLFTDPLTASQVDAGTLSGGAFALRSLGLESRFGELTVSSPLALPVTGGPRLRLAAAKNVNVDAQILTSGGTTLLAGGAVNLKAPLRDFGGDLFIRSGTGPVNLSGNASLQASAGTVAIAGGGGFFNTAKARALAIQPGGGKWIVFSPSPAQTDLGGLLPTTTLYSRSQPATFADISPLASGAKTIAYASGDPTIQTANLTTGGDFFFNDQIVGNGAPSQPTLDPSVQNPTIDPTLYNLQQSPTYHAGVLVPAGETDQQRADRLAKEAVILQLMGLPNDPSLFPFIFEAVKALLGGNPTPEEIAAYFASLARDENARFALGAEMSQLLIDGLKNDALSPAAQSVLTAINSALQHSSMQIAGGIYQAYLDYKQRQAGGPASFGHLAEFSGEGFQPPSILSLMVGYDPAQMSAGQRFGIAVGAGLLGAATAGGAIVAGFQAANAAATGVTAAAAAAEGFATGSAGIAATAGQVVAPVLFVLVAVIALTYGAIKASEINDAEVAIKTAVVRSAKGFEPKGLVGSDEGEQMLAQMLAYQFCVKPAAYAAGVQAAATGTTNLPVTTH